MTTDTPQAAPVRAKEPRFFIDHGMIHDRITGQHVDTQPDFDMLDALEPPFEKTLRVERGFGIEHTLALLNELSTAAENDRTIGRVEDLTEAADVLEEYAQNDLREHKRGGALIGAPKAAKRLAKSLRRAALSHAAVTVAGGEPRNLFAPGDEVKHRKGGMYQVIFRADYEPTMTDCYVYRGEDGHTWVRPALVMEDGRFTLVSHPTPAQPVAAPSNNGRNAD